MMTLDESMSKVKRAGDSETVSEFVSLSADLVLSIDPSINQPVSQCIKGAVPNSQSIVQPMGNQSVN